MAPGHVDGSLRADGHRRLAAEAHVGRDRRLLVAPVLPPDRVEDVLAHRPSRGAAVRGPSVEPDDVGVAFRIASQRCPSARAGQGFGMNGHGGRESRRPRPRARREYGPRFPPSSTTRHRWPIRWRRGRPPGTRGRHRHVVHARRCPEGLRLVPADGGVDVRRSRDARRPRDHHLAARCGQGDARVRRAFDGETDRIGQGDGHGTGRGCAAEHEYAAHRGHDSPASTFHCALRSQNVKRRPN